jgi:hypothetical protein
LGLATSIFVHGLYDFLILASTHHESWGWMRHFVAPLLVGLYIIVEKQLEAAYRQPAKAEPPPASPSIWADFEQTDKLGSPENQ